MLAVVWFSSSEVDCSVYEATAALARTWQQSTWHELGLREPGGVNALSWCLASRLVAFLPAVVVSIRLQSPCVHRDNVTFLCSLSTLCFYTLRFVKVFTEQREIFFWQFCHEVWSHKLSQLGKTEPLLILSHFGIIQNSVAEICYVFSPSFSVFQH